MLADDLFSLVAEEAFRPAVPRLNIALEVLGDNCVARKFNNRGQASPSFLSLSMFRHIAKNEGDSQHWSISSPDRSGTVINCDLTSIL